MSSCNQFQPVNMIKLCGHFVAKQPAGATRTDSPRLNVFWIGPDKVTEGAFMRNLLRTSNDTDLVNRADFGAQTSVDAEKLAIDDGSEDKEVEHMAASLPH